MYLFTAGQQVRINNEAGSFREKNHYVVWNQKVGQDTVTITSDAPDDTPFSVLADHLIPITGRPRPDTEEEARLDVELAMKLLQRHGYAFRIYGREDVETVLDLYAQDDRDPVDTRTFREELVAHVMGGKDWGDLSKKGYDDESTLWNIIEGTRNDHPEWFVN